MAPMTRVALVDDHQIMRDGLRAILEKQLEVAVVGEAADGREAIEVVREARPDIVVMDVSMRGLNGVDATRQIVESFPDVKVIGLSMSADRRYVLAMLSAGASGYLLKDAAADELLRAIDAVDRGGTYLSSAIAGLVVDSAVGHAADQSVLSKREREVLQLLAEGCTSKEIGDRLHVAVSTVDTHRRQIAGKLGLRTVAELTKYAVREGLTALDG